VSLKTHFLCVAVSLQKFGAGNDIAIPHASTDGLKHQREVFEWEGNATSNLKRFFPKELFLPDNLSCECHVVNNSIATTIKKNPLLKAFIEKINSLSAICNSSLVKKFFETRCARYLPIRWKSLQENVDWLDEESPIILSFFVPKSSSFASPKGFFARLHIFRAFSWCPTTLTNIFEGSGTPFTVSLPVLINSILDMYEVITCIPPAFLDLLDICNDLDQDVFDHTLNSKQGGATVLSWALTLAGRLDIRKGGVNTYIKKRLKQIREKNGKSDIIERLIASQKLARVMEPNDPPRQACFLLPSTSLFLSFFLLSLYLTLLHPSPSAQTEVQTQG
jgi:hypothetical protein